MQITQNRAFFSRASEMQPMLYNTYNNVEVALWMSEENLKPRGFCLYCFQKILFLRVIISDKMEQYTSRVD